MEEFGIILTSVLTCDQLSVGFETFIQSLKAKPAREEGLLSNTLGR